MYDTITGILDNPGMLLAVLIFGIVLVYTIVKKLIKLAFIVGVIALAYFIFMNMM